MSTAAGGKNKGRRWTRRAMGALVATATLAAATVVVIGGDVDDAEAAFRVDPPPSTTTQCDGDTPATDLDWNTTAPVTVGINTRAVDLTPADAGFEQPYAGDFTYSIVLDNTGDPFDPEIGNHPSYHPMSSSTPVVLNGSGTGNSLALDLPVGCRYVLSVRADGYDLGGSWIRIEADGTVSANDVYMLQNDRLPLAQVIVRAFHDYAQVNAQFDIGEPGLQGFDVIIEDAGEKAVDYFGNPVCTNYLLDPDGTQAGTPLADILDEADLDADGLPTIDAANPGGNCLTDENGFTTIKYLEAGLYAIFVRPPDTTDWVQTTTIEGGQAIDIWLAPGDQGIGGEFIGDINAGTFQAVGFVSETIQPDPNIDYQYPYAPDAVNGGDITGCFFNGQLYPTAQGVHTVTQNGVDNLDGTAEPLFDSYVALNDVGNHDSMVALAETDANGCFTFTDVPQGNYQLTVWDYELLYIIGFYNVTVDATTIDVNGVVDMGDMFVLRWRGWASGHVFYDSGIAKNGQPITATKDGSTSAAANGVRDCLGQNDTTFVYDEVDPDLCEPGIPNESLLIRNRDGAVFSAGTTDRNGFYEINVWSPMFRFQVLEVGAGVMDFTGHSVHDQFDRNEVYSQSQCTATDIANLDVGGTEIPENCLPAELGGGLLVASIFQQGKRNTVDFGKLSYLDPNAPNGFFQGTGNGGIAGGVINTITRAEWEAENQAAEDNETGLPSVRINLYEYDPTSNCTAIDPVTGATGADNPDCYTSLVSDVFTDSYQHPGLDRNGQTCPMPTFDGTSFTAINPTFQSVADNCTGAWLLGAHTKDGAWNGGFAFGDLAPGDYVVEVEVPAGYQVVKENDLNTEEGNSFVPAKPPAGCVGDYHFAQVPDVYGSPYDAFDDAGNLIDVDNDTIADVAPVRLCDRRIVNVQAFHNQAVDIMLMSNDSSTPWISNFDDTDPDAAGIQAGPNHQLEPYSIADQAWQSAETVPVPGRLFGLVLNDLNMTANQNALTFGEQQGVPNVPIGVYDAAGGYITTFWTDENGHYDILMPSTFSINRATPRGVGPAMYTFVINDPGPGNGTTWGYDPAYITNPNTLDVWPGNMTKADTPLLSLAAGPCLLTTGTPQLLETDSVYGTSGSLTSVTFTGLNLMNADVRFVPMGTDGTLQEGSAIDLSPWATAVTLPTPSDPGSFYDEVTIDLATAENDPSISILPGAYQVVFDDPATTLDETPRNTITFHVLGAGYDLEVINVAPPANEGDPVIQAGIQAAIDSPDVRDELVVIAPGTYRESVVVPEGMVIQGHGSGGIIGVETEIGPIGQVETPWSFLTGTVVSPFGALLDQRMYSQFETALAAAGSWDGNQGVEVGPAFQFVLSENEVAVSDPFQLDGIGITSVRAQNGAVHVNGHADGLVISNMGIQANNSSEGGAAINLGTHSSVTFENVGAGNGTHGRVNGQVQPVTGGDLAVIAGPSDASNDGVVVRDNRLMQNGGTTLAGAVGVFNGNNGYQVLDNDICGNYSAEYGGGMSHVGQSTGTIAGNAFQNNESFDEGGALMLSGEVGPMQLGDGTSDINLPGNLTVEGNHFLYNKSGDDGGAIMVLNALNSPIRVANNVIGQNVATDVGGGMHMNNAAAVEFVHNTVVENLAANSAEDSGGFVCDGAGVGTANTCPRAGGLTSQPHAIGWTPADGSTFSDPLLQNNIFWNNYAGYVVQGVTGDPVQIFGNLDLGVYTGTVDEAQNGMVMNPENSVLSVAYGASTSNVVGVDPQFVLELPLEFQSQPAPALGAAGVIEMVYPGTSAIEEGDYHLASGGSPAADLGLIDVADFDIDGEGRPTTLLPLAGNAAPDAGADEIGGATLSGRMFFSTVADEPNLGTADEDVLVWGLGLEQALDLSTLGVTGGRNADGTPALDPDAASVDIDGLHVLTPTSFLISFVGNFVEVPGVGTVHDEDIVSYDSETDTWTLVVHGTAVGLTGGSRDIDALHQLADGSFLVSFAGRASLPTIGGPDTLSVPDEDIVRMIPTVTSASGTITGAVFEPYFSGSSLGLDESGAGDIDGVALFGDTLLISTRGRVQVGDLDVRDEDVIACGGVTQVGAFVTCDQGDALFFDGSLEGLRGGNDVNAVSGPMAG